MAKEFIDRKCGPATAFRIRKECERLAEEVKERWEKEKAKKKTLKVH